MTSLSLLGLGTAGAQIPAFPGAEGFGAYSTGGRGGDVYYVSNLNSSGPGSLREGIETAPSGGRTIVFAVSGYIPINYNSDTGNQTLRIVRNKVTIAGQTAPGDGIALKDGRILITGNNVVLRHLRIRHGKNGGAGDCLNIESTGDDSIVDHLSMQFSTDENISFFNSTVDDFTMQWSVSAWGLESHNAGGLWDLEDGTCHHSLWAHHKTRNPKARPYGLLEWVNNVTFDWGIGFIMGDSTTPADWKANVIGSYFLSPPGYTDSIALEKALVDRNGNPNFTLHLDNCLHDSDGDGLLDGTDKGYAIVAGSEYSPGDPAGANRYVKAATPIVPGSSAGVTTVDPLTAYKQVVSQAGALRLDAKYTGPIRDEVDTVLFNNVNAQNHSRISSESELAAAPYNVSNNGFGTLGSAVAPSDADLDGMPDFWELSVGSNPSSDDHNDGVPAGAYVPNIGYTLLEEYLHFLAIPHATIPRNTTEGPSSLSTDLRKFVSGFNKAPVVFTISGEVNCTAVMQPDGTTVQVTPPVDFSGRARFDFTVTDGDGSTWTQTFALLVSAVGLPRDLKWKGDGSANVWDSNALNFLDGTDPSAFSLGDNVLFDDTGFNSPGIELVGALSPGVLQMDASQDYMFGGSGSLASVTSLSKTGTGTLTIGTTNASFGGNIDVSGGGLSLLGGTSLGMGTLTIRGNASFNLVTPGSARVNPPNPVVIPEGESGTITSGALGNELSGAVTGGSGSLITIGGSVSFKQGPEQFSGYLGTVSVPAGQTLRFSVTSGSNGGESTTFDVNGTLMMRNEATTGLLGALTGSGVLTCEKGGPGTSTFSVGANNLDTTFSGTVQDLNGPTSNTALVKVGSGTLTLTGANTHSGTTTVSGGTLLVNGTNSNSPTVVSSGGTLGGNGAVGGLLTVNSGGRLAPGAYNAGTLVAAGGVTLNTPTMLFELSGSPAGDSDRVTMEGGLLTMSGTQNYQFNLLDGYLSPGTYTLIEGGDNTSAAGVPLVHNLPADARQTFAMERPASGNGQCYVRLVVSGDPASLVWQGNSGSNWDLTTTNWLNDGAADRFHNFDAVTLNDTAAHGNVSIIGSLQPLSVLVSNSSLTYTLAGGTLSGPMKLTKQGAGTLNVNNGFSHTGGTVIEAGTVALAAIDSLGSEPITLAGGTLAPPSGDLITPLVVDGTGTYLAGASSHTYVKTTVSGSGVLTIIPSGKLWTYEEDLSGFTGSIFLSGSGSLRFNQGSFVWGSPQCAFDLGSSATLNNRATDSAVTVYLGALSGGAGSILQASQQSAGVDLTDTYVIGGLNLDTLFSGTIVDGPNHLFGLLKVGTGVLTLAGDNTYSGGTVVSDGTLRVDNSSGSGTGSGAVTVETGATLGGSGTVAGETTLDQGAILAPGTSTGTLTFDGELTLHESTILQFELGVESDRVVVNGDFFAAGTIEVTDAGGFGPGIYTLLQWNTNQTSFLGKFHLSTMPAGYDYGLSTNTPGRINLLVSSPAPSFGVPLLMDGSLVLGGSGGVSGSEYCVLTSSNVALPASNWVRWLTNQFDGNGEFLFTNPVTAGTPRQFFQLEVP